MIKLPLGERITKNFKPISKYIIAAATDDDENLASSRPDKKHQFIPIDYGARLVQSQSSNPSNELGKQLLIAAGDGDIQETKSLLNRGALFTADWLGTSPLHVAAKNNHLEICEMLLRAGISRDARTKVDRTPLHVAACEGHLNVVDSLVEFGADPECKDLLGMTPLHWAAQNGHFTVVESLIKHGAQTGCFNKFGLSPADLAMQINRFDIVDLINLNENDSLLSEQLTLQLNSASKETTSENVIHPIPIETVLLEDDPESSIGSTEKLLQNGQSGSGDKSQEELSSFDESIKILQEHGITMLPNDDHDSILSSVMESGHSVVLTDVGKEMLNLVKQSEQVFMKPIINNSNQIEQKNVITMTPDELLALTSETTFVNKPHILKQNNEKLGAQKTIKRVVMKKNKLLPISSVGCVQKTIIAKQSSPTDMETVMKQLIEARKTIEEYKVKLFKKEQEAEKYKQQLKQLLEYS